MSAAEPIEADPGTAASMPEEIQVGVEQLPDFPDASRAAHFHGGGPGGDHGPDHFHDLDDDDHHGVGHSHAPVEMAFADPAVLARLRLGDKGVAALNTSRNRRHLTRVAADATLRGTGKVRLGRAVLRTLKVGVGDTITMCAADIGEARRLILEPLAPLSHSLQAYEQELSAELSGRGQLVQAGMLVPVKLADFRREVYFRVLTAAPEQAFVTSETRIVLRTSLLPPGVSANMVTFDDVGGLGAEIEQLRELVEGPLLYPEVYDQLGIEAPRGILMAGPPGVGKTHLARAITNEIGAHFLYVNGPEVLSSVQGGTEANLRAIFEEAMESTPSVVLIDELDAIAPARRDSGQTDARMGTQLLSLLDGLVSMEGVLLLATTNRPEALDPALRRPGRLDREILVGPPDSTGRMEILRIHTRVMPLTGEAREYLPELSRATHGYTGADLMDLTREAGLHALRRNIGAGLSKLDRVSGRLADPSVDVSDLRYALSQTKPSALREAVVTAPEIAWSSIAGLSEEIEFLRESIEMPLHHPEAFADIGLRPSVGVVLYGPPGTGKSMLAIAAARESGANLITVNGPEIFSKWLGESERAIRDVFRLARQSAPAIVVLDQIDAIAPRRTGELANPAAERVVNQLLIEIDGIRDTGQIAVIGLTNRIDVVDPALLRHGRLGARLAIGLPGEEARERILAIDLLGAAVAAGAAVEAGSVGGAGAAASPSRELDEAIRVAAKQTTGLSGADLVAICDQARRTALRQSGFARHTRVEAEHLLAAVRDRLADSLPPPASGVPASPATDQPRTEQS